MAQTTRQIVRTGIAQFFGGATYDTNARAFRGSGPLVSAGLSSVRAYQSKRVNDNDYVIGQAAGRGMGTYMIVYMPEDFEHRRAMGGPTGGEKQIDYTTVLSCFHLAYTAYAEDAEADIDVLVEDIKQLMRNDRTLGGACVQAGEGTSGIRTRINESTLLKQDITQTYFQLEFISEVLIIA